MSRELAIEYTVGGEWLTAIVDAEVVREATPATRWDPAEGPEVRVRAVRLEGAGGEVTLTRAAVAQWASEHMEAVVAAVEEAA